MADFNKYTNYKENAGVSGVVFGAHATVLEVELNEMQEIQKTMMHDIIKNIIGNGITDITKLVYNNGKVKILDGCGITADGYYINCSGLELAVTSGIVYLQIWEEVVDYLATLKKDGNQQNAATITNWFKDFRSEVETTKRKVIKYTLATSQVTGRINMPIATVSNGMMSKIINEINLGRLCNRVDNTDMYDDRDVYGVEVDFENNTITRIANSIGKNGGADFDNINAFNRRRCIITEADGTVIAYYGDYQYYDDTVGYTTKEMTAVNGTKIPEYTNIDTVVEQNKFYYKVVPMKIDEISNGKGYHLRKVRYYISDTYKPGFKVHPAFIKTLKSGATREFDKIYIGAYKSVAYNEDRHLINDQGYENDGNEIDFVYGRLASVSGVKPVSGSYYDMSMSNMRKMLTHMDGDGFWRLKDITVMSMDILLFVIEYATFNAQNVLGKGCVNIQNNNTYNSANMTGGTASLGNKSSSPLSNDGLHSISYRGEEDIYGGLFEFIEGVRISNTMTTWTNTLYPDGTYPVYETNDFYTDPGLSGYINAFGFDYNHDWMFIPTQANGTSDVPVGDIISPYSVYTGEEYVIAYGGNWYSGSGAGICNIKLMYGDKDINCGSRIVYFPYKDSIDVGE